MPDSHFDATDRAASAAGGPSVIYGVAKVRGLDIFYREAGPRTAPVVLLLHGFPSSSHMYRDLIPRLATRYRVIAPDYPGFGHSSAPDPDAFTYDFATLAAVIGEFADAVGADRYALFMQDYGGPVGMRLAVVRPDKVRALIVQNAVVNIEGWNREAAGMLAAYWRNRAPETEAPIRGLLSAATTRFQYTHGATRADRLSPDAWLFDQALLDRPGNDRIQLELLYQYRHNVADYPLWQAYLRAQQPPLLAVWGVNDPFFTEAGLDFYAGALPRAEIHRFDAGHFALETHAGEIAAATLAFLDRAEAPSD